MSKALKILSLGVGIQSTTLLLMSIRGELPRIDHAIFSDTQYEPPAVYRNLEWLKEKCAAASIPLHIVTAGNLRTDAIAFRRERYSEDATTGRKGYASIPLFVLNPDGSQGLIRRQCTSEYKIGPIEKFIKRTLLGLAHGQRAPREVVVEQWFGISWDESQRMRTATEKWKRHVYPFCGVYGDNLLPKFWRRTDCINWLESNYPGREFPRSACICCPYRSNAEWRLMRDTDPESWADAIDFDKQIRRAELDNQARPSTASKLHGKLVGQPFIHRKMIPLDQVDLRDDDEKNGQARFFGMENECEGMCGV